MKKGNFSAILVVVMLTALFLLRASELREKEQSSETSEEAALRDLPKTEDAELFNALLEENLICRISENGRLGIEYPDFVLAKKARRALRSESGSESDEALERQEDLIRALYYSKPGEAILQEVRFWNDSRDLAAVRDNRPHSGPGRSSLWSAFEPGGQDWSFPHTGNIVPEAFGYVNDRLLRPGFCNWLAAYSESEPVRFVSEIDLEKPFDLIVQVIGKNPRFSPPVKQENVAACRPESQREEKPVGNAPPPGTDSGPDAWTVLVHLKEGRHRLEITVSPASLDAPVVEGRRIRMDRKTGSFSWVSRPPGKKPPPPVPARIYTSDGVLLADENGVPTAQCRKLGLVSLVGYKDKTPYALWSVFSKSRFPDGAADIRLTIDSRIQAAADEALKTELEKLLPPENETFAGRRRGAIAVVDPESGAILAAASSPGPPDELEQVHDWDFAATLKTYPTGNPLQAHAWQGMDRHATPGSTFKPVVALAAIEAVADGVENANSVSDFLRGFPIGSFEEKSGLTLDCDAYAPIEEVCVAPGPFENSPPKIRNFMGELGYTTHRRSYQKNPASGWGDEFGLRQAIRDSINVWFVRLGFLLDGFAARRCQVGGGSGGTSGSEYRLVETARRLGFGEGPFDLAPSPPAGVFLNRLPPSSSGGGGDVLYAENGRLRLENPSPGMCVGILAQNSIGQAVTASTLQMALVAASVRNKGPVASFLVEKYGNKPAGRPDNGKRPFDHELLGLLEDGMKAVLLNGTAAGAFRNHPSKELARGKTGTANIGNVRGDVGPEEFHTTWFVGWLESDGNENGWPAAAFSCMVTHAWEKDKRTGGSVAAPVIAKMLETPLAEKEERP